MKNVLERVTLRHLRLLIAIGEEGNLVGAAQQLHMTQPAVTKALKQVERLLGVALFQRTNRGVVPTLYGEVLMAHARLLLVQAEHATEEIADLRDGAGGRVTVGTLNVPSVALLSRAIGRLRKHRPKLTVAIKEGTNDVLIPALRTGNVDMVVGRLPEFRQYSDLAHEELFVDACCVVVRPGHKLVSRKEVRLADLCSCEWILPGREAILREQIDRAFLDAHLQPPVPVVESVSHLTNRRLLEDGDLVTVLPWLVAQRDARLGRVAILPVALRTTVDPIGIATRAAARLSPAAEMLIKEMRSVARDIRAKLAPDMVFHSAMAE